MCKINYDKVSKIYDSVRQGSVVIISEIIEETNANENSRILEIGCGTANNTVLMKQVSNGDVYGMDQSEGMLEKARQKSADIKFYKGDAVLLDCFDDNMFDVVYMVDVIHHIKDIEEMFRNIVRILKDNGKIMIFTNSHSQIKNHRLSSKYFPETIEAELNRYQSDEELISAMKNAKLSEIKTKEIQYPAEADVGEKLIQVAEKKGFSMFHLISQEAIDSGIARIREDMKKGKINNEPREYLLVGKKQSE